MEDNGQLIKSLFRKHGTLNVLSHLASTIGPIVCHVLTGSWYGSNGLAIVALCAPMFFLAGFFGFAISGGASVLASKAIARDELSEVNHIYSAAAILTLLINVVVFGGLLLFRREIMALLTGGETLDIADYYLMILSYAFVTVFLYLPLYFSRVVARNNVGVLLTVVMTVVTLITTAILKPFIGLSAIALGQAIGTASATVLCMFLLRKQVRLVIPRRLYIGQIVTFGSPMGLPRLYNFISALALNSIFLAAGGEKALAVYGVVATLNRFLSAFTIGVFNTVVPLAGVFHEERDITSIKRLMKTAFSYGNVILTVICTVLILLCNQIGSLFGLEQGGLLAVFDLNGAYRMLYMNASLFAAYYNASGRLLVANAITFFQDFALLLPLAWLLSHTVTGVWVAMPLASLGTFALVSMGLALKTRDGGLSWPLMLDERLLKQGKYISFSMESKLMKADEAAGRISDFCESQNLSPKQTMLLSMAIEEMLVLTIKQIGEGFPISVRLFLLDGTIILRIRNGGTAFDPIAYYKQNISDDLEQSVDVVGIKYVAESAKNVYYRQTFGINTLVVVL